MRIAFTGPGGSGKTTLVNLLAETTGFDVITEQFRKAAQAVGYSPKTHGVGSQQWLATELLGYTYQTALEMEKTQCRKSFVSDRTVYDYENYTREFARSLHEYGMPAQWRGVIAADMMMCNTHARKTQGTNMADLYDVVFFVPPYGPEREDDGFRYQSADMLDAEAKAMRAVKKAIKQQCDIHLHTVKKLTIEDRLAECLRVINKNKSQQI